MYLFLFNTITLKKKEEEGEETFKDAKQAFDGRLPSMFLLHQVMDEVVMRSCVNFTTYHFEGTLLMKSL